MVSYLLIESRAAELRDLPVTQSHTHGLVDVAVAEGSDAALIGRAVLSSRLQARLGAGGVRPVVEPLESNELHWKLNCKKLARK